MKRMLLIVMGLLLTSCSKDQNVLSTDKVPSIQSVKTYGGSKNESARSVVATSDGGYAVLASTQSIDGDIPTNKTIVQYDFWVLKFDAQGQLQWQKTYGGTKDDRAYKMITTSDGGFVISGYNKSNDGDLSANAGFEDVWILKLSATGTIQWKTVTGFSGSDQGLTIIQTSDGGYLAGGILDVTASGGLGNSKTAQRHAGGDYWMIKMTASGSIQWRRYFGGTNTDTCYDVVETTDGYIMVGSSDSTDTDIKGNKGSYDFWVVKINKSGTLLWEKSYGGKEIDEAYQIVPTSDGNFLIVGDTRSSDQDVTAQYGGADVWVIKIDADGKLIWQKNYGGSSFDAARAVVKVSNGYVVTGSSRSSDQDVTSNKGQNDIWVIKIDEQGKLIWQKSLGGTDVDVAYGITRLQDQSLVIVGESSSSNGDISKNNGFTDMLLVKLK